MTVTIDSEDPRSIKAIAIAAGAGQWLKVRTVEGELAFGIPSQCPGKDGRYYLTSAHSCDCEDFKRNGLSRMRIGETGLHGPCKHVLAVRLHDELARAQEIRPRPRPPLPANVIELAAQYTRIFGRD